jgi:hypothetical protein
MKTRPTLLLVRGAALAVPLVVQLVAADQSTPAPAPVETREPTRNYTDGGATRVDVRSDFNNVDYWTTRHYPGFRDQLGLFNSGFSTTVTVRQQRIFLPPTPPALGETVRSVETAPTLTQVTLPPVLRSYFYETFYAPLSALMFSEELSRKRRDLIDQYLANRTQAIAALQQKLAAVANSDPDTRTRELRSFAATQADSLVRLEASAEEIRSNLVNGTWLQFGVNWDDLRSWRLGDDTRWESALDEMKVVIGASFFQDGLSPAQRLLLRELAMELADGLRPPDADIALTAPGPYLYFSPFTARIRLPANLPPELIAKIDDYRARKSTLKRELRDTLYKHDRVFFESTRINALKALAEKQAPDLALIEQLAEEIRVGLQPFPNPAEPPASPLPPALTQRVSAYLVVKSTWQKAMMDKLAEVRTKFPDDRVEFSRLDGRPSVNLVPRRQAKGAEASARTAAQAELALFNAEQGRIYDRMTRDKETLRVEILSAASAVAGRAGSKTIDRLLLEFDYALGQQENWLRYTDYEIAVLQPGLSPEQRRLLFGSALEKLGLPLFQR